MTLRGIAPATGAGSTSPAADATSITPDAGSAGGNINVTQVNTQAGGTLTINAPTGSPVNGQRITFRVKCTNVQTFSFNGAYRFSTQLTAPATTTGSSKTDYWVVMYNSTDLVWDFLSVNFGF